ncbi:MAG: hypothetical protein D3924_17195 [Candidatus Electrothrix sp. AR4]|nr:hypothetical protein [Candidatus Electrothrix sp. AR4]
MAHEIGHQFGANHTFNGSNGSCFGGNRHGSTAYEPGSGSTIMAYAGICGADDLQTHSDPIFHSASHDQIISNITIGSGSTCGTSAVLANTVPTVDAGADFTIPVNTPFVLTGSATDDDTLNYLWEQRDLGSQADLVAVDDGQIPLFRVYTSVSSGQRYFPKLATLTSNTADNAEKLPQMGRTMNFRLTARDAQGGVDADDMQVTVEGGSGPFRVTYPNAYTRVDPGSEITVTWNVAGTDNAPVSTASVGIYLSVDGGLTWDTILAEPTPNDGSETVTLPIINTGQARIIVKAVDNIFFDISDSNFKISLPGEGGGGLPFLFLLLFK